MFVKYSQGFVVILADLVRLMNFEALTLIQTNKIDKFPLILVGTKFWEGLWEWISTTLLHANNNISKRP